MMHQETSSAVLTQKPAERSRTSQSRDGTFINILVTPKITFSVPKRDSWNVADDISQEDLRAAFLTRFPIQFDASRLQFACATPLRELSDADNCVVFRIGAEDIKEDRVLLSILSDIDKAYSAKYEKLMEEARADILSSTMDFQVLADEIRRAQQAADKRWEKEVRSLKDQLSCNQKRLFLLEQEKDQLQRAASSSDSTSGQLRHDLVDVRDDNSTLKHRMCELESQLLELGTHLAGDSPKVPAIPMTAPTSEAAVQTRTSDVENCERQLATERLQQQVKAMSQWLQTGVDLLQDAPAPQVSPDGCSVQDSIVQQHKALQHSSLFLLPKTKWSELPSDESEG